MNIEKAKATNVVIYKKTDKGWIELPKRKSRKTDVYDERKTSNYKRAGRKAGSKQHSYTCNGVEYQFLVDAMRVTGLSAYKIRQYCKSDDPKHKRWFTTPKS